MEKKKLLIIVNPNAGKGKMKNYLMDVCGIFSNGGYDVTVYPTKCRGDATQRASQIKQDEFDVVVVSGGDGTLNEVITGIMQSGVDITLGYIPAGTLNEWSSGLGISRNIKKAAQDVVDGEVLPLDIGKFGDKYFSYTASFGAFTEASYSAPQNVKNVLGQGAYVLEGIKSLGNIKPMSLRIVFDGKEVQGDYLFGAISNSLSLGGVLKFEKGIVELNDGVFELVLIKNPKNIAVLQNILDGLLKKDFNREGIEFFHANEIAVIGGEDVSWTLDGEYSEGSNEVIIRNIPSAINFVVPKKNKNKK